MANNIFGYRPSYILLRPWILLRECWRWLRYAWQRVWRGWDDTVPWSVDYYLAEYMPAWLRVIKEEKSGVPISMFTDEELSHEEGISSEAEEAARQRWDTQLDAMIETFELAKKMIDGEDTMAEADKVFEQGMQVFVDSFFNLWT